MIEFPIPPPWMDDALCVEVGGDLFFPDRASSGRPAKSVCAACPVRQECLEYAVEHGERHGIWGGMSERERRKVRRDMTTKDAA